MHYRMDEQGPGWLKDMDPSKRVSAVQHKHPGADVYVADAEPHRSMVHVQYRDEKQFAAAMKSSAKVVDNTARPRVCWSRIVGCGPCGDAKPRFLAVMRITSSRSFPQVAGDPATMAEGAAS